MNNVPLLYKLYISQYYTLSGYKITTKIEVYIDTKSSKINKNQYSTIKFNLIINISKEFMP